MFEVWAGAPLSSDATEVLLVDAGKGWGANSSGLPVSHGSGRDSPALALQRMVA
jgi:hypothetical protein